jgi:hypothetical protein
MALLRSASSTSKPTQQSKWWLARVVTISPSCKTSQRPQAAVAAAARLCTFGALPNQCWLRAVVVVLDKAPQRLGVNKVQGRSTAQLALPPALVESLAAVVSRQPRPTLVAEAAG